MSSPVDLDEFVTIWKEITDDGFGHKSYSVPVTASAKTALKQERFTDTNGDMAISKAVFYTEAEFRADEHYILFGTSTAIKPPDNAEKVRAVSQNPSMFGDLKKGWI